MTMSAKMLNDIAVHAEGLANEAVAMALALRVVVDDCAAQVAANKSPDNPTGRTDPEWVAEAEASVVNEPMPMTTPSNNTTPATTTRTTTPPAKKYTITEVRAFVAERTRPENRVQIKAILKGFGVSKLTELPEDKYGQLMDEVSKL